MEITKKFNDHCRLFIKNKIAEEKTIVNPIEKKLFKRKYPFIARKYKLPFYFELIEFDEIKNEFLPDDLDHIREHLINKIRGIYKHAQSEKTMLCNIDIKANIKLNRFTICVSKNTLEGNTQWTERFIKDMKKEFPARSLKELILICSSSKINPLGNNATHCGNIDRLVTKLTRYNTFRVLFICANHTRVEEILSVLESYENLSQEKQLPIHIQYDEAHNIEDGIPSKRNIIENILLNPIVERLTPCTATENPIHDNNNPLWLTTNLNKNAEDYTRISAIKSDSPEYSSLDDAVQVTFEDIKAHPDFINYNKTAFEYTEFVHVDDPNRSTSFRKNHQKIYEAQDYSAEQIHIIVQKLWKDNVNSRRQLEFCPFLKGEIDGYNMGLNILANYYENIKAGKLFKPNVKNIHLITTPNRVVFTYSLMKFAIEQSYTPIVIGLFRGKINVMYKDSQNKTHEFEYGDFSETGSPKELNDKIDKTLNYLAALHININVPVIIMGNYKPTGESITFVNFTYGPLRSVTFIPGSYSTPDIDYQVFCRENYMISKFVEHDQTFTPPEKIICGYNQNIANALIIEKRNDDRIDEFRANKTDDSSAFVPIISPTEIATSANHENISIPMKIQIEDMEDDNVIALFDILKKEKRSKEDKKNIMGFILKGRLANAIVITDKTGKFLDNFERCSLKVVRTYSKHTEREIQDRIEEKGEKYKPFENDWRFQQYEANHNQNSPYLNYPTDIEQWECQLYACNDRYVYEGFVNPKQRMWLSYRF